MVDHKSIPSSPEILKVFFSLSMLLEGIEQIIQVFDYFPKLFSQRELSWLDDVIPDNEKSESEDDHYENKKLESG